MRVYHLLIVIILLAISPFILKLVFPKKPESPQPPATPESTTSLVRVVHGFPGNSPLTDQELRN